MQNVRWCHNSLSYLAAWKGQSAESRTLLHGRCVQGAVLTQWRLLAAGGSEAAAQVGCCLLKAWQRGIKGRTYGPHGLQYLRCTRSARHP